MEISGFFKKYCDGVRKSLSAAELEKFDHLDTDEARFAFVHNLESVNEKIVITNKSETNGKDINKANGYKQLGNAEFQSERWLNALKFYNLSYSAIPAENASEIAVILANRSAALYHLQKYDLALKDIDRAIAAGYPKDMQYKVKERRARCLLAQKKLVESLDSFKDALHAIDEGKITKERRAKLERDVQVMIKLLMRSTEIEKKENQQKLKETTKKLSQLDDVSNESENQADKHIVHPKIQIDSNEIDGRFAKAEKNISVGEIVVQEKPHVAALLEKYATTHCTSCFKRTIAPIMCHNCTHAIFCSEQCQKSATYHNHECGLLSVIWNSGASITCHLALRIIAQKSVTYFSEIQGDFKDLTSEITDSLPNDDYRKIYNLVRHETQRSVEDRFQRTMMAHFLACFLKIGKFFDDEKHFIFIGGLILRNLQILQFNAHEISELQLKNSKDIGSSVFIGGALYPTLALFNHSCDPGIVRYYKGNTVVARAIKNIGAGEIVAENYGPIFTQVPRDERRELLRNQYLFNCECKACADCWPLFKEMQNDFMRFRCEAFEKNGCTNVIEVPIETNEFMFKCTECGEHTNIFKGLKAIQDTELIFRTANRCLETGEISKALLKYVEMLNIMDETLAAPFRDFHLCQQGIRRCMLEVGNRCILEG